MNGRPLSPRSFSSSGTWTNISSAVAKKCMALVCSNGVSFRWAGVDFSGGVVYLNVFAVWISKSLYYWKDYHTSKCIVLILQQSPRTSSITRLFYNENHLPFLKLFAHRSREVMACKYQTAHRLSSRTWVEQAVAERC